MDLFDFNHDGEVSDLERIMGLAAVLSEANPDVEAYEEWEEQCEQLDEKIEEIEDLLEG